MKKILLLGILLSLIFVSHSFAAYSLSVPTPTSTTITATLSGAVGSTSSFRILVQAAALPTTPPSTTVIPGDTTVQKPNAQGVVTWSIANNTPGTTYNVGVEEIPVATAVLPTYAVSPTKVTVPEPTFFYNHLTTSTSGNNVVLQGLIDPVKQPNYQDFKVYLAYSASADMSNPIQTNERSYESPEPGAALGITDGLDGLGNPAGSYYWVLGGLNPNTTYYARQTIVSNGQSVVDAIVAFNGGTGTVISTPNGGGSSANLNGAGYTLLSPLPGLSFLPDPQVCAQQQAAAVAAGQNPPLCSVNDLLNYALKLLIGVSGVVLVLRLMYEGYQYMVTDVPFLKASSKSGFITALMGLMLALSAYLILNTINPKLVAENVNVQQLAIGVDGDTSAPTVFVPSGQMPGNVYCPNSGKSAAIGKIAQSFIGKVTYTYGGKSSVSQGGYAQLDCSGWANTVLSCAGYKAPGDFTNSGSAAIFGSAESVNMSSGFTTNGSSVSINGKTLNPGDLVGWPSGSAGVGHVILYVGNGTFMDSHSSSTPGGAIGTYSASQLKSLYGVGRAGKTITSVKRIPSL